MRKRSFPTKFTIPGSRSWRQTDVLTTRTTCYPGALAHQKAPKTFDPRRWSLPTKGSERVTDRPRLIPFGVIRGTRAGGLERPGWQSHPSHSSRGLARHERHPRKSKASIRSRRDRSTLTADEFAFLGPFVAAIPSGSSIRSEISGGVARCALTPGCCG